MVTLRDFMIRVMLADEELHLLGAFEAERNRQFSLRDDYLKSAAERRHAARVAEEDLA